MGEELVGVTVGLSKLGVTVGLAKQMAFTTGLQVVLQELEGGKGHNKYTTQPEVEQHSLFFFNCSQ